MEQEATALTNATLAKRKLVRQKTALAQLKLTLCVKAFKEFEDIFFSRGVLRTFFLE